MKTPLIIFITIVVIIKLVIDAVKNCFDDNDPDLYWYDNYGGCQQPYVSLKDTCQHQGDKTLVTEWTACGCEKVNQHCDLCGEVVIEGKVEC